MNSIAGIFEANDEPALNIVSCNRVFPLWKCYICLIYLYAINVSYIIQMWKDHDIRKPKVSQMPIVMEQQPEVKIESHYQEEYFNDYQKEIGEFGGIANKFKFEKHIKKEDVLLDFGCGGGFLLKHLDCREKIGIEINPVARDYCNKVNNIACYESLDAVEDASIDIVISNNCLEHTTNPFHLIAELYKKLKNGGRIVIVVPLDSYNYRWMPNDVNNHLYSFSPMNLGNLLQGTGFTEIQTSPLLHKWVPHWHRINKYFGYKVFHKLSWVYGTIISKKWVQVKGMGIKKM